MSTSTGTKTLAEGMDSEFSAFLLSLGSSVMYHLGESVGGGVETGERNLPLARHTIDILCMLRTKTQGNRTPAEDRLIETLVYDLRMRYVKATKGE